MTAISGFMFFNNYKACPYMNLLFLSGKSWKRMVTKVTYVGEDFTRKPPKFERFIRPMVCFLSYPIFEFET